MAFDSIVNRSHATFAWGSPDIVPMFVRGVPHAEGHTYDSSYQVSMRKRERREREREMREKEKKRKGEVEKVEEKEVV